MKDNVKAVVDAYKSLSEEDQQEFDYETFNGFSYNIGVDDGRKRVAVEQLLELIESTGDLEVLEEVNDEVMEILEGEPEEELAPAMAKTDDGEKN